MEFEGVSSPFIYMTECTQCQGARDDGVEAFIIHLASAHSIPTEWPSYRAARLTGPEAKKPYTTVAATRKKRRKLTTPRPLNSFMIFAQHIRRNVLAIFDTASSSNVSRLLGEAWNSIPKEVRAAYDEEAARLSKIHNIEFPTYKYQPKPRQWQSNSVVASASPVTGTLEEPQSIPPSQESVPNPPISWLPSSTVLTISVPSIPAAANNSSSQEFSKPEHSNSPSAHQPSLAAPSPLQIASPTRSKMLIRDIHPTSIHPYTWQSTSTSVKAASTMRTPLLPPKMSNKMDPRSCSTHNPNDPSSPCLSTSSPLSRTPSPTQQLTPVQENVTSPATNQVVQKSTTDLSAQQRLASDLATLHKLINQAAASSQQTQHSQVQDSSKPCILLTPIQSDIGQQAIISCGQSSTMPTLLTCGNTIYVALTVLQSPLESIGGVRSSVSQEQPTLEMQPLTRCSENFPIPNLVNLMGSLDSNQIHSIADGRLAELLRAAAAAAVATNSQRDTHFRI